MDERKKKLIDEKEKIEEKIKGLQNKLKSVNHKIENIELEEKSKSTDQIVELLKDKGIGNIDNFIELIKAGKVSINLDNN